MGAPIYAKTKVKLIERKCLKCDKDFMAKGKFNRICRECGKSRAGGYTGQEYGNLVWGINGGDECTVENSTKIFGAKFQNVNVL
jgi:hypothetical protein